MKSAQAYIAAIPVALFIAIESVAILLFGPSTTFWIESAFSLVALSLLIAVLLHDPAKKLKLLGISKTVLVGASFAIQLTLVLFGAALKTDALSVLSGFSILLLGASVITLCVANVSESQTSDVEEHVSALTKSMKSNKIKLELLLEEAPSDLKPAIADVLETMRYASPVSDKTENRPLSNLIPIAIENLDKAVKAKSLPDAQHACKQLKAYIRQQEIINKR